MGGREDAFSGRYKQRPTRKKKMAATDITAVPESHRHLLAAGFSAFAANLLHQAEVAAETALQAQGETGFPSVTALNEIIGKVFALGAKGS